MRLVCSFFAKFILKNYNYNKLPNLISLSINITYLEPIYKFSDR